VSPRIVECELTFLERVPIDVERATAQHAEYERSLETLGCRLIHVQPLPDHPDGVFVEDAAVVLDEVAVITRPGASSRRGEVDTVARALEPYRPVRRMYEPACLDGGDVLRVGRTLYAGRSSRTNDRGIAQLREFVSSFGYAVIPTTFRGCLHLKSAATSIADDTVLLNPEWVDPRAFTGLQTVEIDAREPFAGNVLRIGDTVLSAGAHVRTNAALEESGFRLVTVDISEMQKAEAGVTCCSLLIETSS
jgi:dimethylargininase